MREVAKANNDESSNDLCNGWVNVEIFDQHFQAHVVNENTNHHEQEIAEQLHSSMQVGIVENNVAHEEESRWETHSK